MSKAAPPDAEAELIRLRALFMQAPVAIAILEGSKHVFTFANSAYRALVNGRDVFGKPLHEALPDIKEMGFDRLLDTVMATGETFVGKEMPIRLEHHTDDELLFLNFVYTPKRNARGEIDGVLMSGSDVTDQVRARQRAEALADRLKRSEERVRRVLEASGAGLWELDVASGEIESDARLVELMGLPEGSAFSLASALEALPKSERTHVAKAVNSALAGANGGSYLVEFRTGGQGNAPPRWVESRAHATFGASGHATRLAGSMVDITARKVAEEELRAADRRKDEFLTTASHELRTPLNAILGWASMLRSGRLGPEAARKAAETIERNARAQVQLIEDILDGSRIITGKLRLEIRPLDLTQLVHAALDAIRPAADAKQIALSVSVDPAAARVVGDPDRLQQVVWNLCNNAIKFTPKGGAVEVQLSRTGTSIELRVKDTGQGIAPDFLPYVFERFRQADSTTTRRHGGLGLGLALVRHLVDAHGGDVRAESDGVGRGSTFVVILPVQAVFAEALDSQHAAAGMLETLDESLVGVTALVVDDEADARELVAAVLRLNGAEVKTATNADEALAQLAQQRPMVLLSDIGMPGMDGYALIKKIREYPGSERSLPAIALTAYAREEDRRLALSAGFHKHVAKPVEPTELVRAVASLLRGASTGG